MILEDINKMFGVTDSYQVPEQIMNILMGSEEKRVKVYCTFLDYFNYDISYDWFHEYFEDEHADRKNKKQDFTPNCISSLVSKILGSDKGVTYEPAAGTGGMLITNWYKQRALIHPFVYKPNNHLIVAGEMSDKTIPFLLFNLSIRGISGMVFHGNTLKREYKAIYVLTNERNSPISFSKVTKWNNNKANNERVRKSGKELC